MKQKGKLATKISDGLFKLKTYWKKPPKGYYVSFKEFVSLALGYGGISFLSIIIQWTTIATTVYVALSYFEVSQGLVWILGIAGAALTLIRSPILSMIIDNNNSSRGKFKPFLMMSSIAAAICFWLIVYVPISWKDVGEFYITMPAIPIFGMKEASTIEINLAIIALFTLTQVGTFFSTLLNQAMVGIEQTISPVAQERANIGALRGLIANIPGSVVNIVIPILAGSVLFKELGGYNSIELYRLIFPFCAVGTVALILFAIKGTHERVVVNKKYVAKVKFFEGAKILSGCKYFWCLTFFNVIIGIRGLNNLSNWIKEYSFTSSAGKTWAGIYCTTLLMNALVLGMVLGPILIKKYGKIKVLRTANIIFLAFITVQLLFYKQPIVILIALFFQNLCMGFDYVAAVMVSDVMDYLQFKTGKRLEGFWQNYSAIILTVIGIFTGLVSPIALSLGGIGFSDTLNTALQNELLRNNAYRNLSLAALIAGVLVIIPMLFYDLNEKKHANIVRVLKLRAALDNQTDDLLSDQDILNVKEIWDFNAENPSDIVTYEIENQKSTLMQILELYADAQARVDAATEAERLEELARNIEFEEKKLASKLAKAKQKAQKKGVAFDEEAFVEAFKANSRFLKQETAPVEKTAEVA